MATWKFVHAADIHLDSPLQGLERYEGAPAEKIRGATRLALENLVALCIEEEVAFLLIAGDLYDGDWRDFGTGLYLAKQMTRLSAAGIKVFIIRGNHDAASTITRSLQLPKNVHVFSARSFETVPIEEHAVALHGHSYGTAAVTEDLSGRYPKPLRGMLNIGLLHTSADGRPGHESYAPCTVQALVTKGYDYWALGHVHTYEVLNEDPWILFSGSLQGRHVRETGAKGCALVTVEDGSIASVEFRPVDVLRWAVEEIDITAAASEDEVLGLVRQRLTKELGSADGRVLAARLRVVGRPRVHADIARRPEHWTAQIRATANDMGGDDIWLEQIRLETRMPLDLDALLGRDDPVGALLRGLRALRESPAELAPVLQDLAQQLPPELREGEDPLDLADPMRIRGWLEDVEQLIVPRLLEGEKS